MEPEVITVAIIICAAALLGWFMFLVARYAAKRLDYNLEFAKQREYSSGSLHRQVMEMEEANVAHQLALNPPDESDEVRIARLQAEKAKYQFKTAEAEAAKYRYPSKRY